jgi:DNA-binding NarL/FixJ family response regulator
MLVAMKRVTIAIVEPSPIIREGVAAVVSYCPNIRVAGAVDSIADLQTLMRSVELDVVVVAVGLARDLDGVAELQSVPIIGMQSTIVDGSMLRRFQAVATLYTTDEELHRMIIEAVDMLAEHNFSESHELSERERDVLVLVAKGLTNKEIASELNISPHTVISHRKNIVHKTGIRSVAGLTVYAVLNKFIDSDRL